VRLVAWREREGGSELGTLKLRSVVGRTCGPKKHRERVQWRQIPAEAVRMQMLAMTNTESMLQKRN